MIYEFTRELRYPENLLSGESRTEHTRWPLITTTEQSHSETVQSPISFRYGISGKELPVFLDGPNKYATVQPRMKTTEDG